MDCKKSVLWLNTAGLILMVFSNLTTESIAQEIQTDKEENVIYSLMFERKNKESGFNVISSKTWTIQKYIKENSINWLRERLLHRLKLPEDKASLIIDGFFEKNKQSSVISLKSDRSKGYVIDQKYSNMKEGFSYWLYAFRLKGQEYEGAGVSIVVSRPYYDREAGIVLVYLAVYAGAHLAQGMIYQFQYQNENLVEVAKTHLWVE